MSRTAEISNDQSALAALFIDFLKVSLCGFGGGLAWARRIVVEQTHWMNEPEFTETLTLCQLMPGPNIVGIAVCVGAKLRGAIGAITARRRLHPVALGRPTALLFTGLAFVGMAFTKLPLLVVLRTLAPMSIAATAAEGTNP